MATFHVAISFDPADVPDDRRDAVLADERVRGRELLAAGVLQRIWRVPATSNSISIWEAVDEDAVWDAIRSLPIAPWTGFEVTPLHPHPLEAESD